MKAHRASAGILVHLRRLLLSMFLLVPGTAVAQIPLFVRLDNAQNPPGLDWFRIETPHFTVIFPDSMDAEARRTATLLERVYAPLGRSFKRAPERLPVVLNNQSAVSNAFVSLAPRRSEWYALPPPNVEDMGPIDWFSLLAIHEGRHVVQERAVRSGLVGALGRVFGQATTAFAGGLYFPAWFWEGDAVGTETALTSSGRGRQPYFANRVRTMRLNGLPYPFYPAWNGSYETFYPDWYQLGYLLTTHVRRHYGDSAWKEIVRQTTRWPIPPYALSHGIKKVTGRTLTEVHRDAIRELDSLWRRQVAGLDTTAAPHVNSAIADYHVYRLPQYVGVGSIIAEYWDMSTVPRLVRLKDGHPETLIRRFATQGEQPFHVAANRVVWSEAAVDPRYAQRSYLVVKMLDLTTGRVRSLTTGGRRHSPALAPDGRRVAVVRFSESAHSVVEVLDAESGRQLQELPNPEGHTLVSPTWMPDGQSLLFVAIDKHAGRGNALVRVNLSSLAADTLLAFRQEAIGRPVAHGPWIFYTSPASGIDNIEVLDTRNGERFQVTNRPYAARNATVSADGKRLLFQDYGEWGHDIAEVPLDSARWAPMGRVAFRGIDYYEPLVAQEGNRNVLDSMPAREWTRQPFNTLTGAFAFHSRSFAPTSNANNNGLVLSSRNLLNTFGTSVGVVVNTFERSASLEAGASYARWYPIFDAALRVGQRASRTTSDSGADVRYHWNEQSAQLGVRVPLTRVSGLSRQQLQLGATLGVTHVSGRPVDDRFDNNNGDFIPLSYQATASHFVASATRDLLPRGVIGTVSYRHTPFASDYRGHLLSLRGAAYLPGLARHHGLVVDAVREEQRAVNYLFSSEYAMSRGYDGYTAERFWRVGATYGLPLLYPDYAFGPLAYVRRVQGALFTDYGYAARRDDSVYLLQRSYGAEVTADVAPLQLRSDLRVGLRWSYRADELPHGRTQVLVSLPF